MTRMCSLQTLMLKFDFFQKFCYNINTELREEGFSFLPLLPVRVTPPKQRKNQVYLDSVLARRSSRDKG